MAWKPHHITVTAKDLASRQKGGRFVLLPGSPERANKMSKRFKKRKEFLSPRGLDAYTGVLDFPEGEIDVAVVATGMGCPSSGIVISELMKMGVRRFLRVGTAGSLQPKFVKMGDVVIATGAVRDEGASLSYAPPEVPAVASLDLVNALRVGAQQKGLGQYTRLGLVHTKDSLYGREFKEGPMTSENDRYLEILKSLGVLASEMEASHLFILGASQGFALDQNGDEGLVGCVLAIIGGDDKPFGTTPQLQSTAIDRAIDIAFEGIRVLYAG